MSLLFAACGTIEKESAGSKVGVHGDVVHEPWRKGRPPPDSEVVAGQTVCAANTLCPCLFFLSCLCIQSPQAPALSPNTWSLRPRIQESFPRPVFRPSPFISQSPRGPQNKQAFCSSQSSLLPSQPKPPSSPPGRRCLLTGTAAHSCPPPLTPTTLQIT